MAKEKTSDPEKEARRAAKAAKKEAKRSETDGVHKSKSDKKEKKHKKEKHLAEVAGDSKEENAHAEAADNEITTKLLNTLEDTKPGSVVVKEDTRDLEIKVKTEPLLGALVPFANPLADEKTVKKVLKTVKKAAKAKLLKRGVKEVVKSLRQSPLSSTTTTTTTTTTTPPPAIVILAADISPMDVISHLPVLCEDHGVPYIFVPSRAELGAASSTKRPTSVVMVGREKGGKAMGMGKGGGEEVEGWGETYMEVVKVVMKAGRGVRV